MNLRRTSSGLPLSVIVPAYNGEGTIEQCLQSIRASAFTHYELIVVDDGSTDATPRIANRHADQVILNERNQGRGATKNKGVQAARGDVVVFIDQDMAVKPDTLALIVDYFALHESISAVTGLYSKEHPNPEFFSQYKNLYMHYTLSRFPEKVHFLSTIYAVRRCDIVPHDIAVYAEDTELAQRMSDSGRPISFLRELDVVHLKSYNLREFVRNDFEIPKSWAGILVAHGAWRQIGARHTGFHHASRRQLASVVIAPVLSALSLLLLCGHAAHFALGATFAVWCGLNYRFFAFLTSEKGVVFGGLSLITTLLDSLVMATGVVYGAVAAAVEGRVQRSGRRESSFERSRLPTRDRAHCRGLNRRPGCWEDDGKEPAAQADT